MKKREFKAWFWSPQGLREGTFKFTDKPACDEVPVGAVTPGPGTTAIFCKTGDWRTFRPVIEKEKCNRCGLCWIYCPDGVISITAEGDYEVDLDFCKGCGICAKECPARAIKMLEEGV